MNAPFDSLMLAAARTIALAALVCGCLRFDPSGVALPDDAGQTPDTGTGPDAAARPDAAAGPDASTPDAAITPDASPPGPFCDAASPAIVACYQFDDSTGTDLSQYGNDLSITAAGYAPGVTGMALQVDGNSQAVIAENTSLDVAAFTIEMWVNPASLPATNRMGLLDNDGQYGVFLYPNNVVRCSAGTTLDTTYALPIDQWTHIACTNDAATLAVWINGMMQDSTATGAIATGGTNGTALGMNSPSGDNFIGMLDNVRISRVVRTAQEICASASPACTL